MFFSKSFWLFYSRRYTDRSVIVFEFVRLRKKDLLLCSMVNFYKVGNDLGLSKLNRI